MDCGVKGGGRLQPCTSVFEMLHLPWGAAGRLEVGRTGSREDLPVGVTPALLLGPSVCLYSGWDRFSLVRSRSALEISSARGLGSASVRGPRGLCLGTVATQLRGWFSAPRGGCCAAHPRGGLRHLTDPRCLAKKNGSPVCSGFYLDGGFLYLGSLIINIPFASSLSEI